MDTAGSTNEDPLPGQWWKEVVKATEAHDFNFKDFSLLVSAGMTKEKRDPLYNMDYISGLKLPHVYLFQQQPHDWRKKSRRFDMRTIT